MADDAPEPGGTTDTILEARPYAEDDASIVWSRDPVDDEDPPAPDKKADRLWTDAGAQELRDRWWSLQVRFVDDPAAAVRDAGALVVDATEKLAAAVTESATGTGDDTEQLRLAVRRYREILDRILEL